MDGEGRDISIVTNVSAYNSTQLTSFFNTYGSETMERGFLVGGYTGKSPSGYTANRNYIARDYARRADPIWILSTQIHEIGNSLAAITGRNWFQADPSFGDKDNGAALDECVFGGKVNTDGTVQRTAR